MGIRERARDRLASVAMDSAIAELIDAARGAACIEAYERPLFEVLQREIGFDVAFCVRGGEPGPVSPGFQDEVRRATRGAWRGYERELWPMCERARAGQGVQVDLEFFGARRLERMAHYREVMRPHGGRSSLIGYLAGSAGQLIGGVMLGRTTTRVSDREQRKLQRMLPLLSLCERALQSSLPPPSLARLTAREREVLDYLRLGYTNPEIARAFGTSPRTVRNQLSAIFAKLGASTRAEAVAISLGA
jgi:DNA-binding CsgD family transcriptional regulator